jgi:hypothetical protein
MSHLFIDPSEPSRERGDVRSADDHISGQRLAALADEQPTADERIHLRMCVECAHEVEAHRSLLTLASTERDLMGLPLTRWDTLSATLANEGLLARRGSVRPAGGAGSNRYLQYAAALLLVAGGALLGRVSAGASPVPGDAETARVARDTLPTSFASVEEAMRLKSAYRDGYQRAVSYLAQQNSEQSVETPAVMRTRLSALDRVSAITREALNDAPYDPIINDFYLNSFGQREATLRELNTVLPQNVRLNSF